MWDCLNCSQEGPLGSRNPDQLPQTTTLRRGAGPQSPDPCNKVALRHYYRIIRPPHTHRYFPPSRSRTSRRAVIARCRGNGG
jgi:hypothetical protein